ncbi:magnetosome-associated protein MamJ-like isoform X2 [Vanessa atalanta]|uniref:magnetosome-associated protein MamJ-like isoform X2 n=1 Tax=Vanessa atalanta TaxID=42275 RepID=UPI001FCCD8A3|nr:magnetosome-associated protein MamJ-like isoform X2 [Vanessa atalanta]
MKFFLLSLLVAAVAAAPKGLEDKPEPAPVLLPAPVLPEVKPVPEPSPVLLPAPVLPEVEPAPIPSPVLLPAPVLPVIVPEPEPVEEPTLPVIVEEESVPQIPTGEIYNDGTVQVTLNAPEQSYLASLQSWFSMVLNYISNGITTTQQIV